MLILPSMNKDSNYLQFCANSQHSSIPMTAKSPYNTCASSVLPWDLSCARKLEGGRNLLQTKPICGDLFWLGCSVCSEQCDHMHHASEKQQGSLVQKNDGELVAFCFLISFHNLKLQKASAVIVFSMIYVHSSCVSWVLTQTVTFLFMNTVTVEIK